MPWDPTRDLLIMQERLESLFGSAGPGWLPPVDLSESPERYVLTVEVPGLAREQVTVRLDAGTLTVRGERPADPSCPERFLQLERGRGAFSRAFRFSAPVDGDRISADLRDGILTIIVPKRTPAEPGRVDVE